MRSRLVNAAAALALVALSPGCHSQVRAEDPSLFDVDDARADHTRPPGATVPASEIEADEEATKSASAKRTGFVRRSTLDRVLEAGLGAFLASVEVRARHRENRFAGWEVLKIDSPWIDLRPGDVVLEINARSIERPSDAQALWQELYGAEGIVVRAERAGTPFELRFEVTGEPPADAP